MALVFTIASSVAFLAIAIVAVVARSRTPLATPLGLMCIALFAYTSLDAVAVLTKAVHWDWLSYAFAALLAIPTLDVALGFVGMRRRLRWPRLVFGVYFTALAVATASPFANAAWRDFPAGELWSLLMLVGLSPAVIGAGALLRRHAQRSAPEERARTRLLVWSLLLGVGGSLIDLLFIASGSSVRLAALPLAVSSLLVAGLVLRARIFDGVNALTLLNGGVLAVLVVAGQAAVYMWAGTRVALLAFGTLIVMLAALAAARPLLAAFSEQRARVQYLARLGRFVEQMAHDLRNPLAAIQGAAQFLQEERRQGKSLDPHVEFLELIVERVARIERVIRDYQRMGRVELRPESIDVNALVEEVVAGVAVREQQVHVQLELARGLPRCTADRDLITVALENLVRNAIEAMPEGGDLTITTDLVTGAVMVCVRDTGVGMHARDSERAFDDFYTTKEGGSGLGLPFVARIAEAHAGSVKLDSEEGMGTTVTLQLPSAVDRAWP